ncbi:N-acetyl-gamma-glutamyl-phosphate reductase [Nocardia sp. CDC159]|uniref:N-acetyl-gamma-glutamyl-phosphate reductase n=1 Tax=Nocardia pulmonis TaxID=2951408 RepID=A0A9X2E8V5_9NOCA|nr:MULTISPECIES: N-acetyl-gamma-glutamyl-phosphate reductase [Nocardia]MCM6775894.1 N-acetyl-gamma-glutamyl-phosphate reductase [Nocardia pulmonis]MCM6788130.1 N-acetyl-gamma-glutamyl-phosphate reductase [Nocardia sp. CDC159]
MTRVGVIGASGMAGGELIRIIDQHPHLDAVFLGGSRNVGETVVALHPNLRSRNGLVVERVEPGEVRRRCDVVVFATPPAVSARLIPEIADDTTVVIDMSGAFRIRSEEVHRQWYPAVRRDQGWAERFSYGVPELISNELATANLISLPGCYATAVTLALAPLVFELGLRRSTVVIDGKSGSSGGGQRLRRGNLHSYRSGAITPYAPGGHRHAAEVEGFLARRAPDAELTVMMSAYGVGHVRGLLASCYVLSDKQFDARTLARTYLRYYRGQHFVRVRDHRETMVPMPDPHFVVGSNFCDLTVMPDAAGGRVVALAALDNLIKGAAGQAVQAMNHRLGHRAEEGLEMQPVAPV